MGNYLADIYKESIFSIDYKSLKTKGIKCLLFDFDNTLTTPNIKKPSSDLINLITNLKKNGFEVIVFTNGRRKRVEKFTNLLEIKCIPIALKPLKIKFLRFIKDYNYKKEEVAIIGDQIMTDIKGGNKVGIKTILVKPISDCESVFTKINRFFEKKIIKKLEINNLFKRGRYYD